jgi:hypothetical protein
MPKVTDTGLFRKSLEDAGFRPHGNYADTVFNDKHKDGTTRRLKLWYGDPVFNTPWFVQQDLERALQKNFGNRYLFGEFNRGSSYDRQDGKSFSVYLLTA